eukprot:GHUV01037523.1.p1 GENE.GHUV01037523.1~~GHUV01037523.1.p1  ORF type:complete len:119 (-),score=14.40 GHUV01037523.1:679-1035(-)
MPVPMLANSTGGMSHKGGQSCSGALCSMPGDHTDSCALLCLCALSLRLQCSTASPHTPNIPIHTHHAVDGAFAGALPKHHSTAPAQRNYKDNQQLTCTGQARTARVADAAHYTPCITQ